ncbi:MAG: DUF3299 domain-containing protein [Planctomycetota bacterium]
MNDERDDAVQDRLIQQQLEELGNGPAAPDRRAAILARAAAQPTPRGVPMQWLVAAALLIGVATTIAVATSKRAARPAADAAATTESADTPIASMVPVVAPQDPQPQPREQEQGPTPTGGDKPLPKGTDPADLKVLRSAEAMLDAERRLKQKLAEGKIAGVDELLPFDDLAKDWKYTEGLKGLPRAVRDLDGRRVVMIGFMLPIDEVAGMKEFLLVQSLWSCCYGTPPDIHQIVRCVMPRGKTVDYEFEPVLLVGEFRVEATTMDGYVVDIFQLHVDFLEVLE